MTTPAPAPEAGNINPPATAEPDAIPLPWHLMPKSLQRMAESCGEAATLALFAAFKGREIYIPVRTGRGSLLERHLAPEHAAIISQHYGGVQLAVPMVTRARKALIHAAIWRAFYTEKRSSAEIAKAFGYTTRNVQWVLSKPFEEMKRLIGGEAGA